MILQGLSIVIFLLLYGILTIWACYDIYHDDHLKSTQKMLLLLFILVLPVLAPIIYFLWKGNTELDKNIFSSNSRS